MVSHCLWCHEPFDSDEGRYSFCSEPCREAAGQYSQQMAHESEQAEEAYQEYINTRDWATPYYYERDEV